MVRPFAFNRCTQVDDVRTFSPSAEADAWLDDLRSAASSTAHQETLQKLDELMTTVELKQAA